MCVRQGWRVAVVALVTLQAGCASAPKWSLPKWSTPNWFSSTGLPSPGATVAQSKPLPTKIPQETKTAWRVPQLRSKAPAPSANQTLFAEITRGKAFETSGEWDKARRIYEDLRRQFPEAAEPAHRLGVVADQQRKHIEAENLFLFALQRQPRDAELLSDLGYCYYLQGQFDKAEAALAKAVALDGENVRYRNNLGLVVGFQGRYEEALEHFSRGGSEADAYYNLAFVFAGQDRVDEAKECFREALAANPTHSAAREALESFHKFDQLPPEMRDQLPTIAENGVRYVPYQEAINELSGADAGDVQQASAEMPASRDAATAARAMHQQSRGLMNRNLRSQRPDDKLGE